MYAYLVTLIGSPGSLTVFQNVPPDTYSLRVTATTGVEEAVVFWKVYVPANPTICSVNLINFGLVVNGTRTTVEFQGVGPISGFSCRLDNGQFDSCELCTVQYTNLKHASYRLHMFLYFNIWLWWFYASIQDKHFDFAIRVCCTMLLNNISLTKLNCIVMSLFSFLCNFTSWVISASVTMEKLKCRPQDTYCM